MTEGAERPETESFAEKVVVVVALLMFVWYLHMCRKA